MWAIVSIRHSLNTTYFAYAEYLNLVEAVCQFFFIIGIYVGILLCYSGWSKLDKFVGQPALAEQYAYGAVPGNRHAYQGYQQYPQ